MARGMRAAAGGPRPEGMYGVFAQLGIYLVEESDAKKHPNSIIGRVEKHIEREVESLKASDFLTIIREALPQAGMKRVIVVIKNDVNIYAFDQESQKDGWGDAFKAALKESSSKGTTELWVLMSGSNQEFKFRQDITFKEKHTLAAPSMTIVIRALPAEWALQSGEDFNSWMQRLQLTLRDKEGVREEEIRIKPRIEKYLQDYQQLLKGVFAVRDFSQTLRINLSGIDLESFGGNYSIDQAS
jgi:hypothetical protein